VERVWERLHKECGHATARQVYVPAWDRWRWRCACGQHGVAWVPPAEPCRACGAALAAEREEAVLDLEVSSAEVPKLYLDVTVRHGVPGDERRLAAAAAHDGAVASEAERDKATRYPPAQAPWRVVPLALETYGRHGPEAVRHLRRLAREQAAGLAEDGSEAASALVRRWGCRLSVALQRSNAARLRSALGAGTCAAGRALAAALAG
jgi:hypothetical protein